MYSGINSPGSATMPSGNSGKSPSGMRQASLRLGRQQQVVEDRRRQPGFEQALVYALEEQVAVKRVLAPEHRHVGRVGAGLERAVEPPEPVGQELLATDPDVREPGGPGELRQVARREGVDVHDPLEPVVLAVRRAVRLGRPGRSGLQGAAPQGSYGSRAAFGKGGEPVAET